MNESSPLIGWFNRVINTKTGQEQWQCERRCQLGNKFVKRIYVAKHDSPAPLDEGFFIFQPEENLFIRDNWKIVATAAQIIAPLPWPNDHLFELTLLSRLKKGETVKEWGLEQKNGNRRIRYIVRSADSKLVSAKTTGWYAKPDGVAYISPDQHFAVVRLHLLLFKNDPHSLLLDTA